MGDWDCGAEAPTCLDWEFGKTPKSIEFVRKAEEVLRGLSTGPANLSVLKKMVDAIKTGKLIVDDNDLNPQDFLVF
jgi:hypothetical protein